MVLFCISREYDLNTNAGVLAAVEGMFLYLQEKGVPVVVKKGAQ